MVFGKESGGPSTEEVGRGSRAGLGWPLLPAQPLSHCILAIVVGS